MVLLGISGWLGGELIYVHGVGIAGIRLAAAPAPGNGPTTLVEMTNDPTFRPGTVMIERERRGAAQRLAADPAEAVDRADVALRCAVTPSRPRGITSTSATPKRPREWSR